MNPFVPIPPTARAAICAFAVAYIAFILIGSAIAATEHGASALVIGLSSSWYVFWLFWPFFFYRPEFGWCHPLVLTNLYTIGMMVLRKTGMLTTGLDEHVMLPSWSAEDMRYLFSYGSFVWSIALIATYLGFFTGHRFRVPSFQVRSEPTRSLTPALVIACLLSAAAFLMYLKLSGGGYNMLLNLARGSGAKVFADDDVSGLGQYSIMIRMGAVASIIWVCAYWNVFRNPLFLVVAFGAVVSAYLVAGKRSAMIYPALLILLAWMMRHRRVPYFKLSLFTVGAFFILGLLGLYRQSNWSSKGNVNVDFLHGLSVAALYDNTMEELTARSGSKSTYYPILARVPSEVGFLYGRSYPQWVGVFIPRALWPSKPRGIDLRAAQVFYGANWGMPPGAVGEAYWNFHIPGVMAVFFCLGMIYNWFARCLIAYPNAPAVMALYLISVFYLEPTQNGLRAWAYACIPAFLLLRLSGMIGLARPVKRLQPSSLSRNKRGAEA